jgi:hypothetical protein
MGKLIVVKDDGVSGNDKHAVTGQATNPSPPPPPTVPYGGIGTYAYKGGMTDGLSTFVKIGGQAVALVTSQSSLNSGETGATGGHYAPAGSDLTPPTPVAIPASLSFLPVVIGVGLPNASAGSALVTIGGVKVLLDGDKIDTCDNTGSANSTVTASGQSFVSCSA